MAIVETPEGDVIISGGTSRSSLFRFGPAGGEALNAWAELPYPIFNMAFDGDGRLWATTGGGPLLELDPDTGNILAEHGDGITMAMAVEPGTGLIYVAAGVVWSGGVNGQYGAAGGIEIFDPETETFSHYSRDLNLRVASLAFDNDGHLWATTWPDRSQVVRFTPQRRGELMLEFDAPVDSLSFGQTGTDLEGLLFVSHNRGANIHPGSELTMIDVATLRRVTVADGGSRGDVIVTTADGRVLISQSNQVDVLNPAIAPLVIATNPPTNGIAALPVSTITVTFDQQMFTGAGGEPNSVLNPDNYLLVGQNTGAVPVNDVFYIDEANTAHLLAGYLDPDVYTLTVQSDVASVEQIRMEADYVTSFTGVSDFSAFVDIDFDTVRSDRGQNIVSWDVVVTNTSEFDLVLPIVLVLDPLDGYTGIPDGAAGQAADGRWLIELDTTKLSPGQSTSGQTVTVFNENDRRVEFDVGVSAGPGANQRPVFVSDPIVEVHNLQTYEYQALATDPDGVVIHYFLNRGPQGMEVDSETGLVSWTPDFNGSAMTLVELHAYDARGARAVQRFYIEVIDGNRAPELNDLPGLILGTEGEPIEFSLPVTDPDGDPLAVWVEGLPPGATLDPVSRTFVWTPDFESAGSYENVQFFVTDGVNLVSTRTNFAIAPGDQPPRLIPPTDRVVREGERLRFVIDGFDPDGDPVTFASFMLPPGATLDPNSGVFDWTPEFYQHADEAYRVPITIFSGAQSVSETFAITVLNVNGAPVFDNLTGFRIAEDQPISFSAFAFDPDNPAYETPVRNETGDLFERTPDVPATVTYSVTGLPAGASFDAETAMFSWRPTFAQAGTFQMTFTATDDGDGTATPMSVVTTVEVVITNLNRTPEITPIDNQTVQRDQILEIPVSATDPDGNPLELRGENAAPGFPMPDFVTFVDNGDGTGLFRVAPTVGDRGDYGLTLFARDDGDGGGPWAPLEQSSTFIVTVESPNEPPQWNYIGDKVAVVGEPFVLTVQATDFDQEPLQFALSGLPPAAVLTPGATYGSATINWTPQSIDVASYNATVSVQDGGNGDATSSATDNASFQLVVRSSNTSPNLPPIANQLINEGDSLSFVASATDPDGDPLTYHGQGLPEGATLDPATGEFRWTPSYQQAGSHEDIRIIVSDGHRSRFQDFSVFVSNTNRGPVIVPREPLFMREGGLLEFTMQAGDIDGDPIAYSAGILPTGAVFTEDGRFTWTPGYEQAGDYVVTFTATDSSGLSDSTDVTLRIDNINRAPVLDTSFHAVRLGEELRFMIEASDPDLGTVLAYDAADLPQGATVDKTTGEIVWVPGPGQDGEYLVRVFANDGQTTVSQIVVLLAAVELPPPKVSVVLTPSFPSPPGEPILVQAIADSLADVTSITVTLDGQPIALDADGRGQFTVATPGRYEVIATATDVDGLVGFATTTLKVRDFADVDVPVVALAAPAFAVIEDGDIRGTIADVNLDEWTLEIKRFGDLEFRTIASGNDPIADGVLATLDVQDMPNDFYVLRLSARDISRRSARTETIIEVYSDTKRNLVRRHTDLVTTVGGVAVEVSRQYDSVERDRTARAGYGWQLVGRDINLRASVPPTGFESQGLYSAYRDQTRLYLMSPSGEELGFVFEPIENSQPWLTHYQPAWQPLGSNPAGWTLESPEQSLIRGGTQYFDLSSGYPYNPLSPLFAGTDFVLTAPDGTTYDIDARFGVTSQTDTAGNTVYLGESGIVAIGGESVQFITDGEGRLHRLIGPGGEVVQYQYDAVGNLVSVRAPQTGKTTRYGYSTDVDHLLEIAVAADGTGSSYQYSDANPPSEAAILANLGAAATFTGNTVTESLSAGESKRFTFSVRQSEVNSTASGELLVRIVTSATGGLEVGVPRISGLEPRTTHSTTDRAESIFAITREGLYQIEVTGIGGSAGNIELDVSIAGDINSDRLVDGLDSDIQAGLTGVSTGQPGFNPAADLDGSGTIDLSDRQLLFRNAGFVANGAPAANLEFGRQLTHTDLAVRFELDDALRDPDGDDVFYQIVAVQNGTAALDPNGTVVTFTPNPGYSGVAEISIQADDGFNLSDVVTIDLDVSAAAMLGIDIVNRQPQLGIGQHEPLLVRGQFTDQQDVPLIGSYVSYTSSDPLHATIDQNGVLTGVSDGFAAVTASRGFFQAASAVTVGTPSDDQGVSEGIFVYPGSLILPLVAGQRQFRVETLDQEPIDRSAAADGTFYVVGDSRVIDVTADGFATSLALGETTLTIINGPAIETVRVSVIEPEVGTATFGTDGGILQSDDGVLLQIPPGALPDDVTVSLTSFVDAIEPAFDGVFDVGASFELDLGGAVLSETAQVAVPVPAAFDAGDSVYFFQQQTITHSDGSTEDIWLLMETGVVGNDGMARTTSPPYPGFSAGGQYRIAKADTPDQLVMLGVGAPGHVGYSIGVTPYGYGVPYVGGLIPVPYTLSLSVSFLTYRRSPNEIPYAEQTVNVQLPPAGSTADVTVDVPELDPNDLRPVITDIDVIAVGDTAILSITGERFNGSDVIFRQGENEFSAVIVFMNDTSATVEVPRGAILGVSDVIVSNSSFGDSNGASFALRPTYGAVASTGQQITVFNAFTSTNEVIRQFPLSGAAATIFTPENSRFYATSYDGVAVYDAILIRQADANPATAAVDVVSIPGNPFIRELAMDPDGHFLFVAGVASAVWVVDIRAESETFHQVIRTISLPRQRSALSGLAVTADGKHLLVGNGSDEGYLTTFKLDPMNEPTVDNPNPAGWGDQESDTALQRVPLSIEASPDPDNPEYATITYRYRVMVFSPYGQSQVEPYLQRFTTVKLTDSGPQLNDVVTKVKGGNLQSFGTPYYSGYYTNAMTPRDIALAPDLSYAYIGDWELFLVSGYGGNHGDKVGLVRDPFGLNGAPTYLGATTPIEFGFVTSVATDPAGDYLYAAYGGVGEMLVMRTAELIAAGESLSNEPMRAEREPLDQVNPAIHVTPLAIGGLIQGISIDPPQLVDIDVDANNDGSVTRRDDQNFLEAAGSGVIIKVNNGDTDFDGVPDWADGFNANGSVILADADDSLTKNDAFSEIILTLGRSFDFTKAVIDLIYDASDPAKVIPPTTPPLPALPTGYLLPSIGFPDFDGDLRIWTKPASAIRNGASVKAGGDFLAPGQYTAAELMTLLDFSVASRSKTFYIEAVRPSGALGDQRISVKVDPDGPAGPKAFNLNPSGDQIVATLLEMAFIDTVGTLDKMPVYEDALMVSQLVTTQQLPIRAATAYGTTTTDPDNFRIEIDNAAATSASIIATVEVFRDGVRKVGPTPYAFTHRSGTTYRSDVFRLVSNTVDNKASGHGANSDPKAQTIKVQLGDIVKVSYTLKGTKKVTHSISVGRPVAENGDKAIREIRLNLINMRNDAKTGTYWTNARFWKK